MKYHDCEVDPNEGKAAFMRGFRGSAAYTTDSGQLIGEFPRNPPEFMETSRKAGTKKANKSRRNRLDLLA